MKFACHDLPCDVTLPNYRKLVNKILWKMWNLEFCGNHPVYQSQISIRQNWRLDDWFENAGGELSRAEPSHVRIRNRLGKSFLWSCNRILTQIILEALHGPGKFRNCTPRSTLVVDPFSFVSLAWHFGAEFTINISLRNVLNTYTTFLPWALS